ncbi:MAG: OmpW family protein [Methylophilaceae bacterium]|nr:OmpW family outer membrane protein [Methyloradius sp.]
MRKTLLGLAIATILMPVLAHAEAGDWVVRARVVDVSPNAGSDLGKTVNANVAPVMSPGAQLEVDSNVIPEVDISYYFTKHLAAELILAIGTRHEVSIKGDSLATIGNQNLGSVNALPPTLTLQWHFNPDQTIDPYVGAGVNYTAMLDRKLQLSSGALAGTDIKVDNNSVGYALQAGVDINLKDGWLINADVKYVEINTDVKLNTGAGWTKIDSLDINPWLFGVGIGKRF